MAKKATKSPAPLMGDVVREIEALGLTIHLWRDVAQDGWWIPSVCASTDGFIIWRESGTRNYPFPHYETCRKREFGGAHRELHSAVAWFKWMAMDAKSRPFSPALVKV